MKLPWQKSTTTGTASPEADSVINDAAADVESQHHRKGYTPPKGRPTPKRSTRELERGIKRPPVVAPKTAKEAREERKRFKNSMSKEEYKAYKRKERDERKAERHRIQEAMDRGEEKYLLDRDRGPVKAFARDWIDSRRFVANLMMPAALILLLALIPSNAFPRFSAIVSMLSTVFIIGIFLEGIVTGFRLNRAVREKFPSSGETGLGLGFYGFSRAGVPRRWRTPRPRVPAGQSVK